MKALRSGQSKVALDMFDATKAYRSKAEDVVARTQLSCLDDEALYGLTWNTEPENLHSEGESTQ